MTDPADDRQPRPADPEDQPYSIPLEALTLPTPIGCIPQRDTDTAAARGGRDDRW